MEDRNCGCNNQEFMKGECKFETPQGINAAFGYNTAMINDCNQDCNCGCSCSCECKDETRCEMLKNIRCLSFAIVDISEYLNTHPGDKRHYAYTKNIADN